ncbi:MAG: biopolymer transporter ExbD [Rhodospirillales bacterium]|nr:biopolymer transporter ExbD [Rhodospirillales bacterium]
MKIRYEEPSEQNIINMSSLLDVLFILIIFFLATATFQQQEHDMAVSLPAAAPSQNLSAAPKVLVVNVRSDGSYNVSDQVIDLGQLKQRVTEAVAMNPAQKVLIRGDQQALHGHVAAAVATCKHAGVHQANIGYQYNTATQ